MKLAAMFGSSSGAIGATAVAAVAVVGAAVGVTIYSADDASTPDIQSAIAAAPSPPPASPTPAAAPEATPDPDPVAEVTPEVAPEIAPVPAVLPPLLDLVRVDADGNTVVAGRTSPDLPVAILLDGVEVAETRADGAGDFVVLLSLAPSDSPRMLGVEVRPAEGPVLAGTETVLIAPFAAPSPAPSPAPIEIADASDPAEPAEPSEPAAAPTPAAAATEPAVQIAAVEPSVPASPLTAPTPLAAAPDVPATAQETDTTTSLAVTGLAVTGPTDARPAAPQPARAMAPAVVIASPEGLRVVQGSLEEPAVQTSVRLDAISYNAQGAVILAGRGPVDADIQVYLNNQPIQLGEIGPGGDWSLQLPDVDPGTYTLAVAELSADGSTASRVETPFLREDPDRVAEAPAVEAAGIDVITVQPGFTLWGMAENTFGNGILYVQIFEENRDQIRDPDWIFPGQIFRMPAINETISGN